MLAIIMIIIAYLLGSLSSAVITCKAMGLPDPRTDGSQNPGTNNVLRLHGKRAAAVVLAGDLLKGFLPVIISRALQLHPLLIGTVGLAAVFGHMYPVFFKFQGGKGVATSLGVITALSFFAGIMTGATWLIILFISRYVSIASIAAAGVAPVFIFLFAKTVYFFPTLALAVLVIWFHAGNIARLKTGEEPKIKW